VAPEPGVWWGKETKPTVGLDVRAHGPRPTAAALHLFLPPGNRGRRAGAFGRFLQAPGVERWTLCTPRVRACSQQGFTRRRRWRRSRVHPNKGRGGNKRRSGLRCAVRVGGMMKAREKWRKVKGGTEDEMIGCLEFSTERRGRWPRLVVLSDRYTVTTQTTHVFTLQRNRKMTMAVRVRDFKLRD